MGEPSVEAKRAAYREWTNGGSLMDSLEAAYQVDGAERDAWKARAERAEAAGQRMADAILQVKMRDGRANWDELEIARSEFLRLRRDALAAVQPEARSCRCERFLGADCPDCNPQPKVPNMTAEYDKAPCLTCGGDESVVYRDSISLVMKPCPDCNPDPREG